MGIRTVDTYGRVIVYGTGKKAMRLDKIVLQGIMAGVYVGLAGHSCSVAAGGFVTDTASPLAVNHATQKIVYAIFFPTAFISIILTGAELFTGNTMTLLICAIHRRVTVLDLVVNWVLVIVSNFLGCLFIAYFLSYLTGSFESGTYRDFVVNNAEAKAGRLWYQTFLRGIGANTFVCIAVWQVLAVDDVAGKVLVVWFPVVCFCLAGYEHIVANFYILLIGMFCGAEVSVYKCVFMNFVPTLLGNLVGGCVIVGCVYWYACHDTYDKETKQLSDMKFTQHMNSVSMGRRTTLVHDSTSTKSQPDIIEGLKNSIAINIINGETLTNIESEKISKDNADSIGNNSVV